MTLVQHFLPRRTADTRRSPAGPWTDIRLDLRRPLPLARYAAVGLGVPSAAFVLAHSTVGVYHRYVHESPQALEVVNLALDHSLPSYWSVALLVVNAVVALVLATLTPPLHRPTCRSWIVVALVFTCLALDEGYGLHEKLRAPGRAIADALGLQLKTYAWVLPGALIAVAGLVVFTLWCRMLPLDVRRHFLLALAIYFGGALVLESVNGYARLSGADLVDLVGTTLEESMEMAGAVLTAAAMLRLVHVDRSTRTASLRDHRPVEPFPGEVAAAPTAEEPGLPAAGPVRRP